MVPPGDVMQEWGHSSQVPGPCSLKTQKQVWSRCDLPSCLISDVGRWYGRAKQLRSSEVMKSLLLKRFTQQV